MDDAVGLFGAGAQAVGVREVAAQGGGAGGRDGLGRGVGTDQGDHLVAPGQKLGKYRGADSATGAGEEDTHERSPHLMGRWSHHCTG